MGCNDQLCMYVCIKWRLIGHIIKNNRLVTAKNTKLDQWNSGDEEYYKNCKAQKYLRQSKWNGVNRGELSIMSHGSL